MGLTHLVLDLRNSRLFGSGPGQSLCFPLCKVEVDWMIPKGIPVCLRPLPLWLLVVENVLLRGVEPGLASGSC